jgi:hypothetical protein
MKRMRVLVPMAVLVLAACGGDEGQEAENTHGGASDTSMSGTVTTPPPPPAAPGTADTSAGGPIVDTAGVPGPTDTVQGTTTAP